MDAILQALIKIIVAIVAIISTYLVATNVAQDSGSTTTPTPPTNTVEVVTQETETVTTPTPPTPPAVPAAPAQDSGDSANTGTNITVEGGSVTVVNTPEETQNDTDHNTQTTPASTENADAGGSRTLSGEKWDYCGPGKATPPSCSHDSIDFTRTNVAQASGPGTLTVTFNGDFDSHPEGEDDEWVDTYVDGIHLGTLFNHNEGDDRFDLSNGDWGNLQRRAVTTSAQLTAAEMAQITADGTINISFKLTGNPPNHDNYSDYLETTNHMATGEVENNEEYVKWTLTY